MGPMMLIHFENSFADEALQNLSSTLQTHIQTLSSMGSSHDGGRKEFIKKTQSVPGRTRLLEFVTVDFS